MEDVKLPVNQDDLLGAIEELESAVLDLETNINAERAQLTQEAILYNNDKCLLTLLKHKERQIRMDIAFAKTPESIGFRKDDIVLDVILNDRIKKSINEIKLCINMKKLAKERIDVETQNVLDNTEVSKTFLRTLRSGVNEIENKLIDVDNENYEDDPEIVRSEEQELQKKSQEVERRIIRVQRTLEDFLDNNYARPPDIRTEGRRIHYKSFIDIIATLMDRPSHDPYVQMDDTWYEPYVEHLIRYEMAVVHRRDKTRIRLENYE